MISYNVHVLDGSDYYIGLEKINQGTARKIEAWALRHRIHPTDVICAVDFIAVKYECLGNSHAITIGRDGKPRIGHDGDPIEEGELRLYLGEIYRY